MNFLNRKLSQFLLKAFCCTSLQLQQRPLFRHKSLEKLISSISREMGTVNASEQLNFIQRINKDGTPEWVVEPQDYDYHQEIARASYADMLHDSDRNEKYFNAIKLAVKLRHSENKKAIVLDIGTGTGLLSMMALSAGADTVYACEAFKPMAICADKVLKRNQYRDKVELIAKRSTELVVGYGKEDMSCRANILVAEVFDTELIGEGAIEVFNHAKRELVTDDCIVIPTIAQLKVLVVDCPLVNSWNKLNFVDLKQPDNKQNIFFPPRINICPGVPSVHDLQLSEIKPEEFTKMIGEEIVAFEFNWNQIQPLKRTAEHSFKAQATGWGTTIFMWWDLTMDPLQENLISCQPDWVGPSSAWRDHWMQAVYYLPQPLDLTEGSDYTLKCAHDEFSFWFKIVKPESTISSISISELETEHPVCTCGVHVALSRSRIGSLNDVSRREKFQRALEAVIVPGESIVLVISEGSVLGLLAARLGAKKVFILDGDPNSVKITRTWLEYNRMNDGTIVLEKMASDVRPTDFERLKIDIVVGDPFFQNSTQPWSHLSQWQETLSTLSWSFADQPIIIPASAQIKCIAVNFEHLWKIRAPVGTVCGFDLSDFDALIEKSSEFADDTIDSQPLWEYPGTACSDPIVLAAFNFKDSEASGITLEKKIEELKLTGQQPSNGLALWTDCELFPTGETVTTGPIEETKLGQLIKWDRNWKQGVYFFKNQHHHQSETFDLEKWWRKAAAGQM